MEADDLDRAADLTRKLEDAAVAAIRHQVKPQQVQNPDGSWPITDCEDCGEDLAPERLASGRIRCVYCQTLLERRGRGL